MQNDKWEKIIEVFNSALEIKEPERRAFVEMQMNGEDKDALQEVLELLESHEKSEDFIEKPPSELAAEVFENGDKSNIGKTIGSYKIIEQIGHGGMGTVFKATRSDKEFDQEVAIKLLKRGMDTDSIIQRFRYERQILAELNHPNIARLLDGGTTENGLPYFVLEYIKGIPITDYCEQKKLGLNERLNLFRQVCDAISYAHQNLVVHRDIKSSNILVTEDGVPKLLDFGIAKVLQTDSDLTNLTVAGEKLMTPKYASPEQVKGRQITTASDVYSLGVLFYEILTGRFPYDLKSKSVKEIESVICEQEPSIPSSRGSIQSSQVRNKNKERTFIDSKLLKGDLDNIALMALEKEPNLRYSSVDEFSSDIKRYLDGLPIFARKHTYFYRTSKFIRRHSIEVGVAALVSFLLISFTIYSQIQANRIAKERDRSEKVLAFMRDIFRGSNPENAKGREVTARELLDVGVLKVEKELGNQPDVQAELLNNVGQVYQSLGLYDKAQRLYQKALKQNQSYFGSETKEVAETLLNLGDIHRIKANFNESEKNAQNSLELFQQILGKKSNQYLNALHLLVAINRDKKLWDKAEKFALEQINVSKTLNGNESKETISALNDLSDVYTRKGDTENAEKIARQSVDLCKDIFDKPHEEWIEANILLARILFFNKDEFAESKNLLDEAEKMGQTIYGEVHPQLIWILTNKSYYFIEQNKYSEAVKVSNKILKIQKQLYGEEHSIIASALNTKGSHLFQANNFTEAEEVFKKALKMRQKTLGEEHPEVTDILSNLALVKYEQKNYSEAANAFRKSLKIQRKVMKETDPQIGFSLIGLGKSMVAQGNANKAENLIRDGVEILGNSFFKKTWYYAEAQNVLGACLLALGNYAEAEPLLTDSYEKLKKQHGDDHKKTIRAKEYLYKLYQAKGEEGKAREYNQAS